MPPETRERRCRCGSNNGTTKVPTVPVRTSAFVYAAKFVCGEQSACGCECASVEPGRHATAISIHNLSPREVEVRKRFIPVVVAGAAVGREPGVAAARAEDRIVLPPYAATLDDCCRILTLLFGAEPVASLPVTIGFLEITSSGPLAVTVLHTASGIDCGDVSVAVEQIAPTRA